MFKSVVSKLGGSKKESIISPVTGEVVDLTEVPDPVFSEKLMGDGIAIIPSLGEVCSPVDGEVVQIFETKHAISIRSEKGLEIILHIGLETVNLKGKGFKSYVKENKKVKAGDKLISFDLDLIKSEGYNLITPLVLVNMDEKVKKIDKKLDKKSIAVGDIVMEVKLK